MHTVTNFVGTTATAHAEDGWVILTIAAEHGKQERSISLNVDELAALVEALKSADAEAFEQQQA